MNFFQVYLFMIIDIPTHRDESEYTKNGIYIFVSQKNIFF